MSPSLVTSAPQRYSAIIALTIWAILGGAWLLFSTPRGVGLSPDSAVYVGAARSLLQGHGFSMPTDAGGFAPIAHYPPLYSVSLAMLGSLGQDPLVAARWVNTLLFCASMFFVGLIAFQATASLPLSLSAAALLATAYPVVLVHTMAWSEPLFLFCQLAGVFFLLRCFWQTEQFHLVAAATATGLCILSRYAGFASVVAGLAAILWLYEKPLRQKFRAGVIFLAVSLTPISFWLVRNQWTTASGTNRRSSFHLLGFEHINGAVEAVASWFSAFWEAPAEAQVLAASLGLFAAFAWWRMGRDRAPAGPAEIYRPIPADGLPVGADGCHLSRPALCDNLFSRLSHAARLAYSFSCLCDGGAYGNLTGVVSWAANAKTAVFCGVYRDRYFFCRSTSAAHLDMVGLRSP